ncbi:hypothetical protein HMN09_00777200 [Mycena chlorophos]|uniref:Uncharacterized protein n=1 Tax=Mycena chlorophos TaxID=658473 RepID=A0A8H6ST04_MYCCL|nr:hypothetical protein HMN09_00777200 [Mycena chlorophos]
MSTAFQNYQAESASASDSNLVSPPTATAIVNKAHTASNNTTSTIPRKRGYQAAFGADMNDNATGDVRTASTFLADFTASSSISSSFSTSHFASSLASSDNTVEPNGTKPASPLSSGNLASQDDNNKKPSQESTLPTPTPTRKAPKAGLYGPGRRAPGAAAPNDSATSPGCTAPDDADLPLPLPLHPRPLLPTTPSSSAAPAPTTPSPTPPANPALTPTPREKRVRTRIVSTRQRAASASAKGRSASGRAGGRRARQSSALRISVLRRNAFRARRAEMVAKAKEAAVAEEKEAPVVKPQPKEVVVVKTEVKTEVKPQEMSRPGEEVRTVKRGRGREVARRMREATETETGQETPVEREQKRARVGSEEGKSGMVAAKADEQPMEGAEMVVDSE